jgi:phosphatidate phosphatase APP1
MPAARRVAAALCLSLLCAACRTRPAGAHDEVEPAWIELYSSWGSQSDGVLLGRAHKGNPLPRPKPFESKLHHLVETAEALELQALPGVVVRFDGLPGGPQRVTSDDHGFLRLPLAGVQPGLIPVTATLEDSHRVAPRATTTVQAFDASPGVAIISDIDDTLTDTGVTHFWTLLDHTLFNGTWEVKTFPGCPTAVTQLAGKLGDGRPVRPLFFVSGSPWGLHDRISEAFDRMGFPHGAMILRRYSQEPLDPFEFKHPHLLEIFDAFRGKDFVLLGDSGEKDPEVYRAVMNERPNHRVAAVYIHNVTGDTQSNPRYAGMRLFTDWKEVSVDVAVKQLGL